MNDTDDLLVRDVDDLFACVEATHRYLRDLYVGVWETCDAEAFDQYLGALALHQDAVRALRAVVAP